MNMMIIIGWVGAMLAGLIGISVLAAGVAVFARWAFCKWVDTFGNYQFFMTCLIRRKEIEQALGKFPDGRRKP